MRHSLFTLTFIVFLCCPAAFADTSATWNLAGTGDFLSSGNWTPANVPSGPTGVGSFTNAGTGTLAGSASFGTLTIQGSSATQATVLIDGGNLSLSGATIGFANGAGGTISLINDGAFSVTGIIDLGRTSSANSTSGGLGTFLMNSGTLLANSAGWIAGTSGSSAQNRGYVGQSGGVATFAANGTSILEIGFASAGATTYGGQGTYALSGGSLNVMSPAGIHVGDGGGSTAGTFLMSGGTLNALGTTFGFSNGNGYGSFSGGTANIATLGIGGSGQFSSAGFGKGTVVVAGTANFNVGSGVTVVGGQQNNTNTSVTGSTSDGSFLISGGAVSLTGAAYIGSGTTNGSSAKLSNGTLIVSGTGSLTATSVTLARNFNATGYLGIQGGVTSIETLSGPSDPSSTATVSFTGGTFRIATSNLDLTDNGGTFSPGGSGSVGSTTFADKNYVQDNTSTLWIDINSGTFDTVSNGTGTASIAGTIQVQTVDTLTVGSTFDILVASLVTLNPSTLVSGTDAVGHPFSASVVNSGTTLELTVNNVPEPIVLSTGILMAGWLMRRRQRRPH